MKTGKTYIQVFVEGKEENLPKEDGEYISEGNQFNQIALRELIKGVNSSFWIRTIRWYLLPVEQSQQITNFIHTRELTDEEWLKLPKEEILQLYKNCYKILTNYIKSQQIELPSDEEIEIWLNGLSLDTYFGIPKDQRYLLRKGAKWAIEQVKQQMK